MNVSLLYVYLPIYCKKIMKNYGTLPYYTDKDCSIFIFKKPFFGDPDLFPHKPNP
jgi:hypothetical protein